jgi:hypothetical protein
MKLSKLRSVIPFSETKITDGQAKLSMIAIVTLVIAASIWQGRYNLDPHHWGLMLSNAIDLQHGKTPYRDIFIQYGFLTTLIHAASLKILGTSLWALIAVTSFFYGVGLFGLYSIGIKLGSSPSQAFAAFLLVAALHPIVIYPWSNYLAFPFLSWGLFFLLPPHNHKASIFFGGFLLGCAVLCREGLFPPVAVFSLIYCATMLLTPSSETSRSQKVQHITLSLIGTCCVLMLFFIYLTIEKILPYWYKLGIELPSIYADLFFKDGIFYLSLKFLGYLLKKSIYLNPRFMFFTLILIISVYFIFSFIKVKGKYSNSIFLTSILSCLLFSSSLHLHEIFRLATGPSLGAVLVFLALKSQRTKKTLFWLFFITMILTASLRQSGNYFFPSQKTLSEATFITAPPVFYGQRWPAGVQDFYVQFKNDLENIHGAGCGIEFHHNETEDAFLAILSPFKQYQIAPFGMGMQTIEPGHRRPKDLRPDLNVEKKIQNADDIVLFARVKKEDIGNYEPPKNFTELSRYIIPKSKFLPDQNWLVIVVPQKCVKKIGSNKSAH